MFCDNLKIYSSLEKILTDKLPDKDEFSSISVLKNERFSFQIAYTGVSGRENKCTFEIDSPLKEYITVRKVGYVPSELPLYGGFKDAVPDFDENNLINSGKPGLYPDSLNPMENNEFTMYTDVYDSLWFTVDTMGKMGSGEYSINISFKSDEINEECIKTIKVKICTSSLPEQEMKFTQWFHCDCIASVYNVEPLSEKHWEYIEMFLKTAVHNGINFILTPVLTPPLDTAIGAERPTVQLVDVFVNDGKYSFGFDKLYRWFDMCLKNGVKYFEISHLFTQWGAKFCPKVMANVDGEYKRIFGWDTDAAGKDYREFLSYFLPALTKVIEDYNIKDRCYFHISDEPYDTTIDTYKVAKAGAEKYLDGYKIIDALSHIELYNKGLIKTPVPTIRVLDEFKDVVEGERWTYYCCADYSHFTNRFFAYPSWQNRIAGTQLYKYNIDGFLQWGYNFYYSRESVKKINPYAVSDACRAFPSGDSYSVYPGDDCCVESMRLVVFYEALQDMRALKLLETYIGKESVEKIIDETAGMKLNLTDYPRNSEYILNLRNKVNEMIEQYSN